MPSLAMPFDWVERHTIGAVRQGVPLEVLLERSHIRPRHGDARDTISPTQRVLLCMNTVLALEDAAHGLARAGMGAAYPGIGLRMALGSATLEAAIAALARLYGMASNAVHIRLSTEQDVAVVSVGMDAADERNGPYLEENFLVWTFIQCLHFLGRPPPVFEVSLRDPGHFNLGLRHWGIGGPVVLGEVTAFRFPRRLLAAPPAVRAGDNPMWECHQPWLAFVAGEAAGHGGGAPAIEDYVGEDGFVRFADLVRASGRSANTLRRRLRDSGVGAFRGGRRRALAEAATARLTAGDDSVEAVAAELGYSDARALRRFLKAATGLTPQQLRARGGLGPTDDDRRALSALEALSGRLDL